MDPKTLEVLINGATGAGGAVIICILVMYFGYKLIVDKILPAQSKAFDDLIKDSRANRKVFVDAVEVMSRRLDKVEDHIEDIITDVKYIKEKI